MQIIFEFVGGPLDGKTAVGGTGQQDEADRYYALTHHGKIGQRFRVASALAIDTLADAAHEERPYQFQQHNYQVSDRVEGDDEVLVRARYIEEDQLDDEKPPIREHLEPTLARTRTYQEMIERIIRQTGRSLSDSYSYYWPADTTATDHTAVSNFALHLAHVLLGKDFSVFSHVPHPDKRGTCVDLVAIAPAQDCFVACQLPILTGAGAFTDVSDDICSLETYWLDATMTIAACHKILTRVATYCERGYGLVAGLHWVPAETGSHLLSSWRLPLSGGESNHSLHSKLASLNAICLEPICIRSFEAQGSWYLLSLYFNVPHRAAT